MKHQEKRSKNSIKSLTNQQFLAFFRKNNRLESKNRSFLRSNKRHLRADVLSLLSSALRPRLLSVLRIQVHNSTNHDLPHNHFSLIFSTNRSEKSSNVAKIVVITTIFSIFGLFSANFATPVSALSLTLTVPSEALSLNIQPTNIFTKSSPSSVSVKTDAFGGYSLSIKAQSSNELVNGSSKLTSISENQSEEQYQGEGNLNTWGYKPSKFNNLDNTLFLPGPTTSPSVIETTKAANNDAATSYEFILAAKADATIAHGEYKNTFVFSATANTVSYNIKYELNDGQWEGTSPQTNSTAESTVALDSHTPTKTSYEFKGWCPQETHDENCDTTSYQPGNSYPLSSGDNSVTLWAIWKPIIASFEDAYLKFGKDKRSGYFVMQDMNQEICNTVNNPDNEPTATLIDSRDNYTYTVAKLRDGRCWMTQNLRISNRTITSSDSDVLTNFYVPSSSSSGFNAFNISRVFINSNIKYGGYYTWYTATASEGTQTMAKSNNNTSISICPKNWTLPTKEEGEKLTSTYNYEEAKSSPINWPLSGMYENATLEGTEESPYVGYHIGRAWTSSGGNNVEGKPYFISLFKRYGSDTEKGFIMGADHPAYFGLVVRCLNKI